MKNKSKVLLMLPGAIEAMQGRSNKTLSVLSEDQMKINRETFVRKIGNTAILGITGPLVNHLSFAEFFAGYNSYEWIMEDLKNAINDETVANIVLDFDSPGGSSSEMFEMAAYIRKMGAKNRFMGGLVRWQHPPHTDWHLHAKRFMQIPPPKLAVLER